MSFPSSFFWVTIQIFQFSKYQSVEYFIFAGLMAVAAVAFMLLAIFYYEYVPEGAYDEGPVLEILSELFEILIWRI